MTRARFKKRLSPLLFPAVSAYLVARLFVLINRYSVNVPFLDQFDFYFLLTDAPAPWHGSCWHPTVWGLFDSQFGPHRLGVGLVVSKYLANLTHWNFRAETFLIGTLICAAAAAAVALKRRLFGPIAWHDAAIPLFMLTAAQYEIWAGTPDSSHGAFPLLIVMLYCLAWTCRRAAVKYPLILILNFLGIFTGFGFFLGCVSLLLFSLRLAQSCMARRWKSALLYLALLALAGGSLALFFVGYTFNPANPTFRFPDPHWPLYPDAMAIAFARACGIMHRDFARAVGWILLPAALAAVAIHWRRACRSGEAQSTRSLIIAALIAFTLFFAADMVVGRMSLGIETIQASRYVPLMMPGLIGLYFAALAIEAAGPRRLTVTAMLILSAFSGLIVPSRDLHAMAKSTAGKVAWVQTYLRTGQLSLAQQAAGAAAPGFTIYPTPAATHLKEKLAYLRANRLSFFHTGQPQ